MTAASVVTTLFCCRLKHLPLNMKAEALLRVILKYMFMCRQTQLIMSFFLNRTRCDTTEEDVEECMQIWRCIDVITLV